jgi:hypothetical protein
MNKPARLASPPSDLPEIFDHEDEAEGGEEERREAAADGKSCSDMSLVKQKTRAKN